MSSTSTTGLLIGAGSVGKRHAAVLSGFCARLIVVDSDSSVGEWVEENLGTKASFSTNFGEVVGSQSFDAASTLAVVATLGPSHLELINALISAGVRRIYCEKPLATSIADCREIVARAQGDGVRLTVGLQRRFTGLANEIRGVGAAQLGGSPTAIVAHGGAQCLVTTGTHWLDLTCDLFESVPTRVSAILSPMRINPRGTDLDLWQGGATWLFSGDRTLTMSYSNASSSDGQVQVYFPLGRIDLDSDGSITVFKRDMAEVERDPRVTRVGDLVRVGPMNVDRVDKSGATNAFRELVGNDELTYPITDAGAVAEAMLAALIAAEQGLSVDLPVAQDNPLYSRRWAVT